MNWLKTSFNAGKLSPLLDGRVDLAKYYNGCSRFLNAFPLRAGGFCRRSGLSFVAGALGNSRLIPFEFSTEDMVLVEMGNNIIRFFRDGNRITENSIEIDNIVYSLPNDTVSITTVSDHGYSTGDVVILNDIVGPEELNYDRTPQKEYVITVQDSTTFVLDGVSPEGLPAYEAGGVVSRIYQISSPYSIQDVWNIHYIQSGDVIYLFHPDYFPKTLRRLGMTDWKIADYNIMGGPFLPVNADSTILLKFARTGGPARSGYYFVPETVGELTSSQNVFKEYHVGSYFLLEHTRQDNTLSTPSAVSGGFPTDSGILIKGSFSFEVTVGTAVYKLWRRKKNAPWQEYYTFQDNRAYLGSEEEDDVYYTFTRSAESGSAVLTARKQLHQGIVKVTAYVSAKKVNCIVVRDVYSGNSDLGQDTMTWAEYAWNSYYGYPRTGCFHENRLWLAGTYRNPQTLWASKSSDYKNFMTGPLSSDAISVSIEDVDTSSIQWLYSESELIVGTSKKEYKISANNTDSPITPSDCRVRTQSSYGCFSLQPAFLNNSILYFQNGGNILRSMRYSYASYRYESENLTVLAEDIFENAPKQITVQRVPFSCLWVVRQDGVLVSLIYEPNEEVYAFSEHITGGIGETPVWARFISACVIRENNSDVLYTVVERYLKNGTVCFIEKMNLGYPALGDSYLDSSIAQKSSFPKQTILAASGNVLYGYGRYGDSTFGIV